MIKLAGETAGCRSEISRRYDLSMPESFRKKVATLVRGRGVAGACAHVLEVIKNDLEEWLEERSSLAQEAEFDRRRGVHTSARIDPKTLSVIGSHRASAVRYQPISEDSFRTLLARLIDLVGAALPLYRFIDMGCGMGKVLLLAAEHPFRQVIGVEFAPDLVAICEKNLREDRAALQRRCHTMTVVLADAADFCFPRCPLVVFLYNPFGPDVLAPLLNNLCCVERSGAYEDFVVYHNAQHAQLLQAAGFTPVWENQEDRILKRFAGAGSTHYLSA